MRDVLQRMFERPFLKVRPAFLTNPATGYPLELDAFNAELKLGAEFHGVQHYEFPNPFHSTRAQFEAQQRRDALKVRLCQECGVRLLVVPHTVNRDDIEAHLKQILTSDPSLKSVYKNLAEITAQSEEVGTPLEAAATGETQPLADAGD